MLPLVHIFELKRVNTYPDRPRNQLNVEEADRLDFDEAMLPEDSWERTLDGDGFEVEKIMDVAIRQEDPFWKNSTPTFGTMEMIW